jgi:hypothetical protein
MFGMGLPEIIVTVGFVVIAVVFVKYFFIRR